MNINKNIYKIFVLRHPDDVDRLVDIIKKKGNFTIDDYICLLKNISLNEYRSRIYSRMKHKVFYMIESSYVGEYDYLLKYNNVDDTLCEYERADNVEKESGKSDYKEKVELVGIEEKDKNNNKNDLQKSIHLTKKQKKELREKQNRIKQEEIKRRNDAKKAEQTKRKLKERERHLEKLIETKGFVCVRFGLGWLVEQNRSYYFEKAKTNFPIKTPFKVLSLYNPYRMIPGRNSDLTMSSFFIDIKDIIEALLYKYLTKKGTTEFMGASSNKKLDSLFDDVKRFKDKNLKEYIFTDFLEVPISDVKVLDGEIEVNLNRTGLTTKCPIANKDSINPYSVLIPCKKDFIKYILSVIKDYKVIYIIPIILEFYDNYMLRIIECIRNIGTIKFETYISAFNFNIIYKTKPVFTFSIDKNGLPKWSLFNHLKYSDTYLIQDDFKFDDDVKSWALDTLKNASKPNEKNSLYNTSAIKKQFEENINNIGLISKYYYEENEIPAEWRCQDVKILRFFEDRYHISDMRNGYYYLKSVFLVWSETADNNIIKLYTRNDRYKNIAFVFDNKKINSIKAAFIIVQYFTFSMPNKRSSKLFNLYLNAFGIYDCYRFDENI